MATLDTLLMEFGTRSGTGALAVNDDGVCRLVFDEVLRIDIEERDGEVSLSGLVGSADDLGPGTLRIMLAANLLGDETAGGALAIDEAEDTVVLCRRLPLDELTYTTFERSLAALVDAIQEWRPRFAELAREVQAVGDAQASSMDGELHIFRA